MNKTKILAFLTIAILSLTIYTYAQTNSLREWKFTKIIVIKPQAVDANITIEGYTEVGQQLTINIKIWTTNNETIQAVISLFIYWYNETSQTWERTYYKGLGLDTLTPTPKTYQATYTPTQQGQHKIIIKIQEKT